ncbi:hypothetical protein ADICEAN_03456 [Cesiribacter andamanensis AMV16]|uniref:Uncharacterized protein n=1 Tax=Cesiribacter andamanensis AMV16 TaxID=1279009 RepID=M7N284_9BACT|nr:hypothetical protein ADICEAN_03456 [Cesiribacter andamanensis AMV16]
MDLLCFRKKVGNKRQKTIPMRSIQLSYSR